jgi:hypothetical protein
MKNKLINTIILVTISLPAIAQNVDENNTTYESDQTAGKVFVAIFILAVLWRIFKKIKDS